MAFLFFDPGVSNTFILYFRNESFVLIHKCSGGGERRERILFHVTGQELENKREG